MIICEIIVHLLVTVQNSGGGGIKQFFFVFMYIPHILCLFYCLYQQMHAHAHTHTHTHITILNYITNAPTCFGASAPSSESFDIVFAEVTKY